MKFIYMPEHAKSTNDVLHFDTAMYNLSKLARLEFTKLKTKIIEKHVCTRCAVSARCELHHIKPVWAYALQAIVDQKPQSMADVQRISSLSFHGTINIADCNQADNLRWLCHACHTEADSEAEAYWKAYFCEHYPVVFRIRDYKRFEYLLNNTGAPA